MPLGAEDERNNMPGESPTVTSLQQGVVDDDELHCPLCGGFAGRKWRSICLINLVIFLFFAMLAFMFLQIGSLVSRILFLICAGITIFSLFTLPITGAMAVAARPRCRICGHRFWPASGISNLADNFRFPVRYAVISSAILLVSFCIVVALVTSIPGREIFDVTLTIAGWIIMAGPTLGVALLIQAILWRVLRARMDNANKPGLVLLLPIVVLIAGFLALTVHVRSVLVSKYNPLARAPQVLALAKLANLPESARDVHVHTPRFFFLGEDYLCFQAEPEDIEKFLADSPGLKGITCHTYSKEKMRLATLDLSRTLSFSNNYGHEYFCPDRSAPAWYKEEIRGVGRYYNLSEWESGWIGELIVDDEQHVVYVHRAK